MVELVVTHRAFNGAHVCTLRSHSAWQLLNILDTMGWVSWRFIIRLRAVEPAGRDE